MKNIENKIKQFSKLEQKYDTVLKSIDALIEEMDYLEKFNEDQVPAELPFEKSLPEELLSKDISMNERLLHNNWLNGNQVCEILGVSSRTLQNYRDKGYLPFSKIGNKIYYKASDIEVHLENHYHKAFKARRLGR